ncbi:hypothetical protein ACI8AF_19360 [Blastococcus sp. SYSU D00669]
MFLLVLAVPAFSVVVVGYAIGSAVFSPLGPQRAEAAGWITGVALLAAVTWGARAWWRRRGRRD